MRKLHPILTEAEYTKALVFIAQEAEKLCQKLVGQRLPIDTLTIFAQSPDEYDFLENLIGEKGPVSPFTHGTTLYIEVDEEVTDQRIKLLGVRRPDTLRAEVGYADFPVKDLNYFKQIKGIKEITSGQGIPLLELKHPDFDVRGYIVER